MNDAAGVGGAGGFGGPPGPDALAGPIRPVSRRGGGGVPLYHQVEQDLRRRIRAGEWTAGQAIPPEAALCALYGASRITIRQAVGNLVGDGLLVREPGRGTFVREPWVMAGIRGLTSFSQEMQALGLKSSAVLLGSRQAPAAAETAAHLRTEVGDTVVEIRRVRLGDGKPIAIQVSRLLASRFPGLEHADLAEGSLYDHLARVYGVVPERAEEVFRVGQIRGEAARLLEVRSGSCVFLADRTTFDDTGPYEYVESVLRGDRYEVRLGLTHHDRR
jgi:GntR family transcriptional regulator